MPTVKHLDVPFVCVEMTVRPLQGWLPIQVLLTVVRPSLTNLSSNSSSLRTLTILHASVVIYDHLTVDVYIVFLDCENVNLESKGLAFACLVHRCVQVASGCHPPGALLLLFLAGTEGDFLLLDLTSAHFSFLWTPILEFLAFFFFY